MHYLFLFFLCMYTFAWQSIVYLGHAVLSQSIRCPITPLILCMFCGNTINSAHQMNLMWYWWSRPGVLCNIGNPSETHPKPKSRKISFAHNVLLSCSIVLDFHTEHDSITAMLCAKFRKDWTTETDVMGERVFTRVEFKNSFVWVSHIAQDPALS